MVLLLKSDERERWDPRCAELEWFEEIRFNFQRQKLELCCCRRVCVCVGGKLWQAEETFKLHSVSAWGAMGLDQCGQPKADPAGKKENYFCGFLNGDLVWKLPFLLGKRWELLRIEPLHALWHPKGMEHLCMGTWILPTLSTGYDGSWDMLLPYRPALWHWAPRSNPKLAKEVPSRWWHRHFPLLVPVAGGGWKDFLPRMKCSRTFGRLASFGGRLEIRNAVQAQLFQT